MLELCSRLRVAKPSIRALLKCRCHRCHENPLHYRGFAAVVVVVVAIAVVMVVAVVAVLVAVLVTVVPIRKGLPMGSHKSPISSRVW